MAKQPLWTYHQAHASWYSSTTKADLANALCELIRMRTPGHGPEEMKAQIRELVRAGNARYGKQ